MWRGMGRRAHVDHPTLAAYLRLSAAARHADGDATRAMQTGLVFDESRTISLTLGNERPAPVGTASPVQFDNPGSLNFKP